MLMPAGYPGGIFDPAGFAKGDMASLKLKEGEPLQLFKPVPEMP